jgi:LysM repeat protein
MDIMVTRKYIWFGIVFGLLLAGCTLNASDTVESLVLPTLTPQLAGSGFNVYLPLLLQHEKEVPQPTTDLSAVTITDTPIPVPNVTNPPNITPNPTVCVPPNGYSDWVLYTVQFGDTLSSLANRSGTTVTEIQLANCLSDSLILAGKDLYLPAAIFSQRTGTPTPSATQEPPGTTELPPETTATSTPTATPTWTVEPPDVPGPGNPYLTIDPLSGPPGTTFTILVDEFKPHEELILVITFVDEHTIVYQETATVDDQGNVTLYYVSQADTKPGNYLAEAFGLVSSFAGKEFEIATGP